jgi:hypothetical protein
MDGVCYYTPPRVLTNNIMKRARRMEIFLTKTKKVARSNPSFMKSNPISKNKSLQEVHTTLYHPLNKRYTKNNLQERDIPKILKYRENFSH